MFEVKFHVDSLWIDKYLPKLQILILWSYLEEYNLGGLI